MSEHETDLHYTISEVQVNLNGVGRIGEDKIFDKHSRFRARIGTKELQILRPQPAQDISLGPDLCTALGKDRVAARVVEMIVRVDDVTDRQTGNFANLREQVFCRCDRGKRIDDGNAIASDNKSPLLPAGPPSSPAAA